MSTLKLELLRRLRQIDGLTDEPSPVAGGTALFYRGKALAHFHDDHELDLRLTAGVIRKLGLSHPSGSVHHPGRSASSAWIEVRFASTDDLARVVHLVREAAAHR